MSSLTSGMKRIQYSKTDGQNSSFTIDELIFEALDASKGNALKWCREKAHEVRRELEKEALQLQSEGRLVKKEKNGLRDIEVDEYVKGKVSNGVRTAALKEVLNPILIKKD